MNWSVKKMPKYDGQIRIKASIDADGIDSDVKKLEEKFKKQNFELKEQTAQLQKMGKEYANLLNNTRKSNYQISLEKKLENLQIGLKNVAKNYDELAVAETASDGKIRAEMGQLGAKYDFISDKNEALKKKLNDFKTEMAIDPASSDYAQKLAAKISEAETNQKSLTAAVNSTTKALEKEKQKMAQIQKQSEKMKNKFSDFGAKISNLGTGIAKKFTAGTAKLGLLLLGFSTIISGARRLISVFSGFLAKNTAFQNSLARIRGNLLTAFAPIYHAVLPAINALAQGLAHVTGLLARFIAMLFGKTVETTQKMAQSLYSQSSGAEKASKSYKKLDKSAKNTLKTLASFDKLHILEKNEAGAQNDVSIPEIGENISQKPLFGELPKSDILTKFADGLKKIYEFSRPARDSLAELWQVVQKFYSDQISPMLNWLWNDILKPMGKWVISKVIPQFFDLIRIALSALSAILNLIKPGLSWLWNGILKPIAKWTGGVIVTTLQKINEKLKDFGDWVRGNKKDLDESAKIVGAFFTTLATIAIVGKISAIVASIKTLVTSIGALSAAIAGFLALNPWVAVVFSGIAAIIGLFQKMRRNADDHIRKAIEEGKISVPKGFFPQPPNYKLPRFAQGAVLRGGDPFLAMLGDQRRGQTNIETPLKTMIDAFKTALASQNSGSNIVIQANGDLGGLIRFLNLEIQKEQARIGQNFVKGDVWI
jgi:hypothetical protein